LSGHCCGGRGGGRDTAAKHAGRGDVRAWARRWARMAAAGGQTGGVCGHPGLPISARGRQLRANPASTVRTGSGMGCGLKSPIRWNGNRAGARGATVNPVAGSSSPGTGRSPASTTIDACRYTLQR
jgi:hypothetical protein